MPCGNCLGGNCTVEIVLGMSGWELSEGDQSGHVLGMVRMAVARVGDARVNENLLNRDIITVSSSI